MTIAARQTATYPTHRFKGARGPHVVDGRALKVGEVIELTEAQAEAWADRFVSYVEAEAGAGDSFS